MDALSDRATALAFFALDHAIETLGKTKGPLVPFVMTERGEHRKLERFAAEQPEGATELARQAAARMDDAETVAIALDGFVTLEGKRAEAVIVEVSEAGGERSYIFGRRYRTRTIFRNVKPVGSPVLVGYGEPLFEGRSAI